LKITYPTVVLVLAASHRAAADPLLTLKQAQAEAREHAPERALADASVVAARSRAAAAGHWITHDPVAVGRYQQPTPGQNADDRTYGAGLEWTLDISGAWAARSTAARASVQGAQEDRTAALRDLDALVANACAELADAQRRLARANQLLALSETAVHAAERRKSTGDGNQVELDTALLEQGVARVARANTQGDLEGARARLARLLGRHDERAIAVSDDLEHEPVPPTPVVDDLAGRDPRVRAAVAELDAARAMAQAEHLATVPEITLGVALDHAQHDVPAGAFASLPSLAGAWKEWEFSVQLSMPLPLFARNRVARADATAQVVMAEARLAQIRADVRTSVAESRARLTSAVEAADAAAEIPQVIQREIELLDKALRAGSLDLASWAQQARRLAEAGNAYDDAVLALRRARAAWTRLDAH
jgi:cobalt-zinc-cadmium efflux system outer membrane protein